MAQKRTDYSKFTQPNGTIQVLMLWASVALHLMIGSNLGLFGRLDPIKVKPAGGTVRVVDLTPAEQTRVPEAAKSKPLPIAPTPVNPEIATRTSNQLPPRNPGASAVLPPRNRPSLPPPSSQLPPTQPVVPTNSNSKKPELSDIPRDKRSSQEDGLANDKKGKSVDNNNPRQRKEAQPDKDDKSQTNDSGSEQERIDRKNKEKKEQDERDEQKRKDKEKKEQDENDPIDTEDQELQTVLDSFKQKGVVLVSLEIPKKSLQVSICKKYKKIRIFWPIDENGKLLEITPIFLPKNSTLNENYTDPAKEIVKKAYNDLPLAKKKTLANKFADYSFPIPFGRCNT